MRHENEEDGMGFSGLASSASELREERELKRLRAEVDRLRELLTTIIERVNNDPDVRGYELAEIAMGVHRK